MPSVAVVILNWNGKKYLEQFLPSVLASTYTNYFVVLVDNASTDDSLSYIQQHYPSVRIISNPGNEGFARGYNLALKQVVADYYVLLNSDVEVTPGWIDPIIALMESNKNIAACQPKILSYNSKTQFEYAGASGGWIDKYAYPFSRGRVFDVCETDVGQYDDVSQVFWATGASLFVRSSAFHSCGGFDEYFFAHQEEIDLCWRMQLEGHTIFVQPASVVYHVGGGTLPMGDKRKVFLNFRNNMIMLSKNNTFSKALWKVPFRLSLDNVAAAKALFTGNFSTCFAIVKAHLHYLRWLFFERKKSVFPTRRSCNLHGVYNGLVIWQYFMKKKKKFSEIVV
jgi:GT2 family glycosyltransferase